MFGGNASAALLIHSVTSSVVTSSSGIDVRVSLGSRVTGAPVVFSMYGLEINLWRGGILTTAPLGNCWISDSASVACQNTTRFAIPCWPSNERGLRHEQSNEQLGSGSQPQ